MFSEYTKPECSAEDTYGSEAPTRTHETEHPDIAIDVEIPEGFTDESWCNDSCPHFVNEKLGLDIWIDHQDELARDVTGGSRYTLCTWTKSCRVQRTLWETDDWDSLLLAMTYIDFEKYHLCIQDCLAPEEVVEVMDAVSERFYSLRLLHDSYDSVAMVLAEMRDLFVYAGERWESLMMEEI